MVVMAVRGGAVPCLSVRLSVRLSVFMFACLFVSVSAGRTGGRGGRDGRAGRTGGTDGRDGRAMQNDRGHMERHGAARATTGRKQNNTERLGALAKFLLLI